MSSVEVLRGWLFDCYAAEDGWIVWIVADDGRRLRLVDRDWQPSFFLRGPREVLQQTIAGLLTLRVPLAAQWTTRKELFEDQPLDVLQVFVQRPFLYQKVVSRLLRTRDDRIQVFNCDLGLASCYFYERGLFPTARVEVEVANGGMGERETGRGREGANGRCAIAVSPSLPVSQSPSHVVSIRSLDNEWDVHYESPIDSLRVMEIRPATKSNPNHERHWQIEISIGDGLTYTPEPESPRDLIENLNRTIDDYDPDVLLTDWGDSFLFPRLLHLAHTVRVPLHLHRDDGLSMNADTGGRRFPRKAESTGRVRSYAQYGRMVFQPASYLLRGRWHVDRQNCFLWREGGWEGLLEVARVAKLSVQHMTRTSVGRGITAMQLETLHRHGYLVPYRKHTPEDFKTADELVIADKGGLVYHPRAGFYENVAEIDFASMYPALMTSYNISPETVNCRCCSRTSRTVPETDYRLCDRREGFVPKTLRPLLEKRAKYKRLRDGENGPNWRMGEWESGRRGDGEKGRRGDTLTGGMSVAPTLPLSHSPSPSVCDARQSALKWLLVVCFGYLGYKNARFGRIEAHESVTAWSREILLQAKEIAESRGFEMVHAIVDCVWVHKAGATVAEYEALTRTIAEETGIAATLEGLYRWLRFVPSAMNPRVGVPNRYLGVFQNGQTKVRGLALRRHDTPRFIRGLQQRLIDHFAQARSLAEFRARIPRAQTMIDEALVELRSGLLDYSEVAIFRSLSQPPEFYRKPSHTAIAAGELVNRGFTLHAGEGIEYVVTNASHKIPSWRAKAVAGIDSEWSYDPQYYEELLLRACEEVFHSNRTCQIHNRGNGTGSEPRP